MNNLGIRKLAPIAALLLTFGAALASAHDGRLGHRGMGRGMGGDGMLRMFGRLDLTDEQKAQVRQIMEARKPKFEALREKIRADHEALRAAADNPSPNPAAVGDAFLRVQADREALKAERQATMEQIRGILTAEQKERFDSMKQKSKERFRDRADGRDGAADF